MKLPLALLVVVCCLSGTGPIRQPMKVDFENSASYRWLNKPVLASRMLDDMESLADWKSFTVGAGAIVDARATATVSETTNVAEMSLSTTEVHSGHQSLLLSTPTRLEGPGPVNGRGWGRSGIRRIFAGEDWTASNRLSFWIYPELPGFYTTALDLQLFNDGVTKLPALFGQEGETSLILKNHEWNHVVWEIGNVARDKVTALEMTYGLSGSAPGEADSIRFYFDRLDLERVAPDKIEGWDVWAGRISYCHAGYTAGAVKSAIASGLDATAFQLIDQQNGEVVLSKPIQQVDTHLGHYQVMDFSEVRKAGTYVLEAGSSATRPFPIGPDVWEESIWKELNFLYGERCGAEIPGIHGVCHRDWTCVHNNKRIVINGGWHDAGDLSQGMGNTGEIVYGLFSLAEQLHTRNGHPELYDRVLEEARWGLDWIMKTGFGDGYRSVFSISSRRTNDVMGDFDDVTSTARNDPQTNFVAAAAEAIAYRVLKKEDPRLATQALQMARADWTFAVQGMDAGLGVSTQLWTGTFDSDSITFELPSEGILAAVNLWKATGDSTFKEKAVSWAPVILHSQQRKRTDWEVPLSGFFYTSPAKNRILHFVHRGRQQAHILALTELCQAFPDHPDWMKWYAAVTLYDEYLKTVARYTAPYNVMPASIYNDTEYLKVPESRRASFRNQVLAGIPLGKGNYLRLFPVWMDYRGHFGPILSEALALSATAQLRGDLAAAELASHQLEWVVGRNPFSESAMYGEGYDFCPLYSPSSGDIVGALPVGIETRGDNDVPYWPVQSTWTYKEVWMHPAARWVWLMKDLSGPAVVSGQAPATVRFKELTTGQELQAVPNPETMQFRISLPEGKYVVQCNGLEQSRTFLPGASYAIDLRPGRDFDFDISAFVTDKGELTIKVNARGMGIHHVSIRTDNLTVSVPEKELSLRSGQTTSVEWKGVILSKDTPWVLVVVPDGDLSRRKDLMEATRKN